MWCLKYTQTHMHARTHTHSCRLQSQMTWSSGLVVTKQPVSPILCLWDQEAQCVCSLCVLIYFSSLAVNCVLQLFLCMDYRGLCTQTSSALSCPLFCWWWQLPPWDSSSDLWRLFSKLQVLQLQPGCWGPRCRTWLERSGNILLILAAYCDNCHQLSKCLLEKEDLLSSHSTGCTLSNFA